MQITGSTSCGKCEIESKHGKQNKLKLEELTAISYNKAQYKNDGEVKNSSEKCTKIKT